MPELPDVAIYIEALDSRICGQTLTGLRLAIGFEGDLYLVLHLVIAGRVHWVAAGAKLQAKRGLAAFDFPNGTLTLCCQSNGSLSQNSR